LPDDCLFCRIVSGEVAAPIVFEDEVSVGFLDHRPLFPGHTLLVPREHVETLADLPDGLLEPYFRNVRMLSVAIPEAMGAQGTFVAANNIVSQSVPHLHFHVVPRVRKDGLRGFFWPRQKYRDDEHAAETAGAIRDAVAALR
jgi:histidine triad (HIT) family protein